MKNLMKISILAVFLASFGTAQCQDLVSTANYRVTAFKNGDNQVFSRSNEVEVEESFTLYVPNTFTPNGDGLNETFGPVGNGVNQFSMLIFNRWGELIFESDNIYNQWDGTHHGEKVQTDTYVYKIFATGEEAGVFKKAGKITVII